MADAKIFKIDRSQRMHSHRVVVRVYQIFGTERYGWDTNREQSPQELSLYDSRAEAEHAADASLAQGGHICDEACYAWRDVR